MKELKPLVISDGTYRAVQALEVAKRLADNPVIFSSDDIMTAPWPDVAIGAGEKTAGPLLEIKKHSSKTFIAIALDPRKNHRDFDLIIMPSYEPFPVYPNVITTIGLINHVNRDLLRMSSSDLIRGSIEKKVMCSPMDTRVEPEYDREGFLTILIGGKHVGGNITADDAKIIAEIANTHSKKNGGAVLVATCKRTEKATAEALKNSLAVPNFFYEYNGPRDIPNPYISFLALAKNILVTGDSVRMVSEAASAGKPLFIYDSANIAARYKPLHEELYRGNYAAPYREIGAARKQKNNLDEAGRIAEFIKYSLSF